MRARTTTLWTAEKVDCLRKLWARDDVTRNDMVQSLNFVWAKIEKKAAELGLDGRRAKRSGLKTQKKKGINLSADVRHRASLGLGSPIELKSGRSLFGAPIKAIDPDTRALIDAALAKRAVA